MSSPILECFDLQKTYGDRAVLQGLSLSLQRGERLALTGPSGCGKTTLLNCLGGIDRPDSGRIRLLEHDLTSLSPEALAALRRESIGTIFQFFHLLPTLSVRENIEFPLQLLGLPASERRDRSTRLLDRVRLQHRSEALPTALSGGEMQRAAIARALIHQPALLLADEPTGNLDSQNGTNILELLREMTDESGTALLLVTHSAEAAAICHRILRLRDGRIESEHLGPR
jgi:putative ABC transport system ATP-binding protein